MGKINEHDMTKKMMDIIRNNGLREQNELTPDGETAKDISFKQGQPEFDETAKGLRQIDAGAKLNDFKVHVGASPTTYAEMSFTIPAGIMFFCSTKTDREFSMSIPSQENADAKIYLDEALLGNINKLRGYYVNWYKEWSEKLATETDYQTK